MVDKVGKYSLLFEVSNCLASTMRKYRSDVKTVIQVIRCHSLSLKPQKNICSKCYFLPFVITYTTYFQVDSES